MQDPDNPAWDYGPCGSDYRHIENATLVIKEQFQFRATGLESLAVNGWELAPCFTSPAARRSHVTFGPGQLTDGVGNDRPNLVPGVSPYVKTNFRKGSGAANREYLNPAAFAQVTAPCGRTSNGCQYLGTYGNIGRNSFRGPAVLQFDSQISRVFPIHESLSTHSSPGSIQRAESSELSNPDSTAQHLISTFGQVSATATPDAREFQGSVKISF